MFDVQCSTFLAVALAGGSLAAAEPNLKTVFPLGCQRGESMEVTFVGDGLDDAAAVYFSGQGITAEQVEKNRWRVSASDEATLGDCDLWIATAEGVAGPRRFSVLDSPVIAEKDSGEDDPQPLALPSAIDVRLDKATDLDWFTFQAAVPQELTILARSTTLDGSVQPALTLFAPDGSELAHSSAQRLEPQLSCQLPAAGTYRLLVHDRAFRHDDFSFYRLRLITGSPTVSGPPHIALAAAEDSPPPVDEQATSTDAPQPIELPCRIAGTLAKRSEVDWFRFTAQKDQLLHVAAFGERLDQLMDLELAICDADGKPLKEVADLAAPKGAPGVLPLASLDPEIDWKVPADGDYLIAIRDLYGGSVFGPQRNYELLVEPQQPSLLVVAMPSSDKPGRGVFVNRGGETTLDVHVVRTGGFAGTVTVRAEDPVNGLTIEPCTLAEKEVTKAVKLSATAEAPTGFHPLRLVAEAEIGSDKRNVPIRPAALVRTGVLRRVDHTVVYVGP